MRLRFLHIKIVSCTIRLTVPSECDLAPSGEKAGETTIPGSDVSGTAVRRCISDSRDTSSSLVLSGRYEYVMKVFPSDEPSRFRGQNNKDLKCLSRHLDPYPIPAQFFRFEH